MNSHAVSSSPSSQPVLGIIAGSGRLPEQLIEACRVSGREIFVLGLEDCTNPEALRSVPHAMIHFGAIGQGLEYLRNANVREVVLAGKVARPSLPHLRLDSGGVRLLGRLGLSLFAGDDAVFRTVVKFLEDEGFHVLGSDHILGSLLVPEGVLGKLAPEKTQMSDIEFGFKAAKKLGARDIGQAVVVDNGAVLGAETADGTDALLEQCRAMKRSGGVLVKAKKPSQETRVDLPTIGLRTVELAHAAGLKGIAVEAGASLILDREKVIALADTLGVFVIGIRHD